MPDSGWTDGLAWLFIVAGLVLVALFVLLGLRTRNPLLPMRIVLDRNRGGAYLTSPLVGAGAPRGIPLPEPVLPAGAGLRAGRGGTRLAADHPRRLHLRGSVQRPAAEGRAEATDGARWPAGRRRALHAVLRRAGDGVLAGGYTTAFTWAALLLLGALVSAVPITATKEDLPAGDAVAHVG